MNKDIRVLVTCPDHPKIKKLMRKLGDKSFWCLIRFWCFVAINKPKGDISSYDLEDIEIGAGWDGEHGAFYNELITLKFIDTDNGETFVHDWDKHNGWVCGAPARSEKARKAAKQRWDKKNAPSINEQYNKHGVSNAPSPNPSPSPSTNPNPNPKDNKKPPVEKFHPESMRPDWIAEKDWADLISHRKNHPKKPVNSKRAYEAIIKQLSLADKAGFPVEECVDRMTTSSWVGFKADWMKKDKTNGHAQGGFGGTNKRIQ